MVCAVSHALLPAFALGRRLDSVAVIGAGVATAVTGSGMRRVAEEAGVPHTTMRDWRRRSRANAPVLARELAALLLAWGGPAIRLLEVPEQAALQVLGAIYTRAKKLSGAAVGGLWTFASAVTGGAFLATTITPPLARGRGPGFMPTPLPATRLEDRNGP